MIERLAKETLPSALRSFLQNEAAGGIILMAAAALAILIANSTYAADYLHFLHYTTGPELTPKLGPMTLHLWINDGLMAIFFLYVGLEIKREFVDGELTTWSSRRLPFIAALSGMMAPALVYIAVVHSYPQYIQGWAIPAATDIAFAIGVLALLGKRAPTSLKLFLVTVAIVDDMGAVAIIAFFYTAKLSVIPLFAAALIWALMMILNRLKVTNLIVYGVLATALWYATLLSGVHATVAGVMAAFAVPFIRTRAAPDANHSPLHRLEHALAKPVAFFIVPLFGFANAGVSLHGFGLEKLLAPLPLAIALGLFLGKQLGIFSSLYLAVKMGIASRPSGASWTQLYGVSLLCGIGFTMSLFIGNLAMPGADDISAVKIGVLAGSLLSALCGWLVLRFAPTQKPVSKPAGSIAGV